MPCTALYEAANVIMETCKSRFPVRSEAMRVAARIRKNAIFAESPSPLLTGDGQVFAPRVRSIASGGWSFIRILSLGWFYAQQFCGSTLLGIHGCTCMILGGKIER